MGSPDEIALDTLITQTWESAKSELALFLRLMEWKAQFALVDLESVKRARYIVDECIDEMQSGVDGLS